MFDQQIISKNLAPDGRLNLRPPANGVLMLQRQG